MLTIGVVAGEVSGDSLGADFIRSMRAICPDVRFVGVGGVAMQEAGLVSVIDMTRLSVMGIVEVVTHLPDLLHAKREILAAFDHAKIDVFIGIDAPDFNLRLGKILKTKGVFCVQYVSPSIWAWRESRIYTIKQSTHLVLCLFPFEVPVYTKHSHPAVCVGHPLIKTLAPIDQSTAIDKLAELGVPHEVFDGQVVCLMAGSRESEIAKILPVLLDGFDKLQSDRLQKDTPHLSAIIPVAKPDQAHSIQDIICERHTHLMKQIHIISPNQSTKNPAHLAMQVCDITLLASGTATLEALLLHAPMVVVYRVNALTYEVAKRLIKTPYVALPNILSSHEGQGAIVPELIQHEANASLIKAYARQILSDTNTQKNTLIALADYLKQHAAQDPAKALLDFYHKFAT